MNSRTLDHQIVAIAYEHRQHVTTPCASLREALDLCGWLIDDGAGSPAAITIDGRVILDADEIGRRYLAAAGGDRLDYDRLAADLPDVDTFTRGNADSTTPCPVGGEPVPVTTAERDTIDQVAVSFRAGRLWIENGSEFAHTHPSLLEHLRDAHPDVPIHIGRDAGAGTTRWTDL